MTVSMPRRVALHDRDPDDRCLQVVIVSPWSGFEQAHIGFCEARLDGWIAEPANAWSSMVYVAVGAYLALRARRFNDGPLVLVGATAVLIGLGSFVFHATGTFVGEFTDEASMFLLAALMATLGGRRVWGWGLAQCTRMLLLLSTASALVLVCAHGSGVTIFALNLMLVAALEIWLWCQPGGRGKYGAFKLTLALFGGAYGVWWLDFGKVLCDPDNHTFGGHALWHSVTALSLVSYQRFQEQFAGVQGARGEPASPAPAAAASSDASRSPEKCPLPSLAESVRAIRAASSPVSSSFRL